MAKQQKIFNNFCKANTLFKNILIKLKSTGRWQQRYLTLTVLFISKW